MTSLEWVNTKYRLTSELQQFGVEIDLVEDSTASRIDTLLRQLIQKIGDDVEAFRDLMDPLKALRWRLLTDIQAIQHNTRVTEAANAVSEKALYFYNAVDKSTQALLDELRKACDLVINNDSPAGGLLLDFIQEVGEDTCSVLTSSTASKDGMKSWLQAAQVNTEVYTLGDLLRTGHEIEQIYVVGPPRFYSPALLTSPTSSQISFIMPNWYRDRKLRTSDISEWVENKIIITPRIIAAKETIPTPLPDASDDLSIDETDLLPQPHWEQPTEVDANPGENEVLARKVILSGGYTCLLDDGSKIQTFDPSKPKEDRFPSTKIDAVTSGTYLVLRKDQTEQMNLYEEAIASFGSKANQVIESQNRWKKALQEMLHERGRSAVEAELQKQGVNVSNRVQYWTEPALDMPLRSQDFRALLHVLGINEQPSYTFAKQLHNKRLQLGQEMRRSLKSEVEEGGREALNVLESNGMLELSSQDKRFRDMVVIRVIAISPNYQLVARQKTRTLFKDDTASTKWLE
ncbi:hypothetical protein KIM372_01220 [Bombiscardovia nodaiensis]|uniref:Uncharacterized protein n=1 Tax=Bombiscardovia nodaiensis TaxID=2932181 RepID=A0ABM8B5V8_9BIFI|nr:hypothetical protein KIM372_01220 [Bombiscardovia nodaiensis]